MKRKWNWMVIFGVVLLCLTGCGEDEVKVVNKLPAASTEKNQSTDADKTQEESLSGYIYQAENTESGAYVEITTDIEASAILEALGEADSYFEAASCAFQGLDKMYTYPHVRIETYPEGEQDIISAIIFLDDLAETAEGISIGMSKAEMEAAYGTDYEETKGMIVYTKDGKHLSFLLKEDVITSIEYTSAVLDNIE